MRVLFILCRDPFVQSDGANYAIRSNLRLLSMEHEVSVTGFGVTFGRPTVGPYRSCGSLGVATNSKAGFLLSLLRGKPYTITKYGNKSAQIALASILAKEFFDCLWFEQTQSAFLAIESGILPLRQPMFSVLRPHNVESTVIRGAINTRIPLAGLLLAFEARLLARAERVLFSNVDVVAAIADTDMGAIQAMSGDAGRKVVLLPVAADREVKQSPLASASFRDSLLFVGNCEWGPNRRAVEWLIDVLAPSIEKSCPGIVIRLVGRGTETIPKEKLLPNTTLLGYVEDIEAEYRRAICAIVPVRDGGGINIKVIESLTRGVPVVGSKFAKRGIECDAYHVAETPAEYAALIQRISSEAQISVQFADKTLEFVQRSERDALRVIDDIFARGASCAAGRTA